MARRLSFDSRIFFVSGEGFEAAVQGEKTWEKINIMEIGQPKARSSSERGLPRQASWSIFNLPQSPQISYKSILQLSLILKLSSFLCTMFCSENPAFRRISFGFFFDDSFFAKFNEGETRFGGRFES